jgi:ribonucleoside-diphosphate reductase alpha chain
MSTFDVKGQSLSSNQTRIAQVAASFTEPLGLPDRQELENITNEAIRRIEGILPGMENLVKPGNQHPVSDDHIISVIKQIIRERDITIPAMPAVSQTPVQAGTALKEKTRKARKANAVTIPATLPPVPVEQSVQEQKHTPLELLDKPPVTVDTLPVQNAELLDNKQPFRSTDSELKVKETIDVKIELSPNAMVVLEKRYLKKDKTGKVIESVDEMFRRVAKYIASAELVYNPDADISPLEDQFYRLMASLEFLPNSPTLMNAGRELGQLSACFVIPVNDSMESIFDAVKYTALIHKSGGGTGFSFSRIRPSKDRVGSTGGVASGPISFMRAFDTATDVIKQGGMRRGANMAILNVDHPDILDFIVAKEDPKALTNFNLSVAATSKFMEAVERDEEYDLVNPHTQEITGKLKAKEVFDRIISMAWRTGDPGIIFIDNINLHNPTPHLGKIESTNPCGEQPLLPFESCNLGSINLSKMVKYENNKPQVDYDKLAKTVRLGIHFLDNVIDVNQFPLPQIAQMTRSTRKVGLGVMGFADLLIILGIPYNSEAGIETAGTIMRFISDEANSESVRLGIERGLFPEFKGSIYDGQNGFKPRNASRTTIAPTGTLSIIAGCSSGIEPLFALSYKRHILDGETLIEVHPYFAQVAQTENFYSADLIQQLAAGQKLCEFDGVPDHVKNTFVTSHDIAPEWHVKMQAAFQKSTDSAVSKTVNLPHEATPEDVGRIYLQAFQMGLKGLTIYRDRSRETQVLNIGHKDDKTEQSETKRTPRQRPKVTTGITERVNTGCGYIYVTVNFDEHGICEVFSSLGKAGGCASAQLEATCRLISLALRTGIDTASITKQIRAIRCPSVAWEQGKLVLSCADAIGSVLEKYIKDKDNNAEAPAHIDVAPIGVHRNSAGQCPECGSILVFQEGCHICPSCGYTKCG